MKKFSGIITVYILASCCYSYAFEDDINKFQTEQKQTFKNIDSEIQAKNEKIEKTRKDNSLNEFEKMTKLNVLRKEQAELLNKKVETRNRYMQQYADYAKQY